MKKMCDLTKAFPNQKLRMTREVHPLLKAGDAVFRSGDQLDYSSARANLGRGIFQPKHIQIVG